jgi:hypothetical protein
MKLKKPAIIFSALFLFFSCGIQEYYYLPQVPESYITSSLTDSATIRIPPISQYYYATNYSIFYRIYISGENLTSVQTTSTNMNSINPDLAGDFNWFLRYTDTSSTSSTSVTTLNTFKSRNYYEIELDGKAAPDVFSINGGTLSIRFPTLPGNYPAVSLNNGDEIRLRRSGELISPLPQNDLFFRNTADLNSNTNATANNNADVAGRTGITQRFAYVSMYIVARGKDGFSSIYGKPTHINIFKLPDIN